MLFRGLRWVVVVGQWGMLQMCLRCRQPQTSLASFSEHCEKGLQLVYSISIINELLGIFAANKDNRVVRGNRGQKAATRMLNKVNCRGWENLMYKYNLPHTQTLMWPVPLGPSEGPNPQAPFLHSPKAPTSILLARKMFKTPLKYKAS